MTEWKEKRIPPKIRRSGNFLEMLVDKGVFQGKEEWVQRIMDSNKDRRELIHRNVFFTGDLKDKHIKECVSISRELDGMVQKHKRENKVIFGK